jgi:hypothetical protein
MLNQNQKTGMRNPKCLRNAAKGNVELKNVSVTGVTHVIFAKRS